MVVDTGLHVPVSFVPQLKARAKAHFEKKTVPPRAATRHTRGPVFFKFVLVHYDKAEGKVKLGEFVGQRVRGAVGHEDDTEDRETVLAFEDEGDDLAGTHIHGLSHQVVK